MEWGIHNRFLAITTYVTGILTMESGALVNLTISFDMQFAYWDSDMPYLTIYGSKGSLNVPDMNKFEGPVTVRRGDAPAEEVPVNSPYTENCRGLGLADMAHALQTGKAYRPSAELSLHVTEVMLGLLESVESGKEYQLTTTCARPAPLDAAAAQALQQ